MSLVAHEETKQAGSILSGPVESREFPDWFRDQQRAAWQQFESLPKPTRKDQAWRFSNVDLLDLSAVQLRRHIIRDGARNYSGAIARARRGSGRMIFAGDQLIERDVISDQLKKRGVIFQSLERAMVEHADLVPKTFHVATERRSARPSSPRCIRHSFRRGHFFTCRAASRSNCRSRFSIGCDGENAPMFPHLLLVTDELAKVTVIEHFRSCRPTHAPRLRVRRERSRSPDPARR